MRFREQFVQTTRISWQVTRLIWETSRPYTVYISIILLASATIPILEAYFIKKIIDTLTLSLSETVDFNIVLFFIALFVLATLFNRLIENQRNSSQIILGNLFNKHIHQRIVEKTSRLEFWRFEDPAFKDMFDRVRDHATWKPLNTFYYLVESLQSVFILVSIFAVLWTLHPVLLILMALFSLPSLLLQIKYGQAWFNLLYQETTESRRLNYYQHLMTCSKEIKDIKLLNLGGTLFKKYKTLYEKLFNEQKKFVIRRHFFELGTYFLSDIILVGFYIYLSWKTFQRALSIGDFSFYSGLYGRGINSLHNLMRGLAAVYENNLFIKELSDFLELPEEKEPEHPHKPTIHKGFEFKDVWFKYPGTQQWILKGVSFTIHLKKNVALVGENGAGKTTIVKLLTRLYTPTHGEILLDGVPIKEFKTEDYRNLFGIAFQDFAQFFFTVEDNLRFGDPKRNILKKELIDIAKKVHIHKKVMSLPNKYKTILGRWFHEGHEISYGEWQRLAVGRALVRKAPVYILDEPTSALDAKAEYEVFKEFKRHIKGKTAVFISHRFSNVKLASEIIVLEHGKIIESGSHSELLKKKGRYHQLYHFQARQYRE